MAVRGRVCEGRSADELDLDGHTEILSASLRHYNSSGRKTKPSQNPQLQRWAVSKRVNISKSDADDATLIDTVELEAA